ncbi:hypothetical protein [Phaeacidiphilus oryzae]|uniref:hypothetical protein n=1 Tax=Phaeacidiphilus oryzae TaxID=348818 RepID=UPI000AECBDB1|nr:hypothetical protein [Phaeacidiphilus oryzae]
MADGTGVEATSPVRGSGTAGTATGEAFSLMAKEGGRVGSGALGAGQGGVGDCPR